MEKNKAMALYNEHDDEDEFFGNDKDDDDENSDILDLADRESRAKEEELKKIAYVEGYDDNKETRLQEGFEAGYKETFEAAMRIGEFLGKSRARTKFSADADHTSIESKDASINIALRIRQFLKTFEETATRESDEARQELEQLFRELQESP